MSRMSRPRHRAHNLSITIPSNERACVVSDSVRDSTSIVHVARPVRIAPHVYLSGEMPAQDLYPYDVVINVAREVLCPLPPASPAPPSSCFGPSSWGPELAMLGISSSIRKINGKRIAYYTACWDHDPQLAAALGPLTRVVHNAVQENKRVLVHCKCGISRSATLVLAYVMLAFRLDYSAAYAYVKERHPELSPNLGLIAQLLEWQSQLEQMRSC